MNPAEWSAGQAALPVHRTQLLPTKATLRVSLMLLRVLICARSPPGRPLSRVHCTLASSTAWLSLISALPGLCYFDHLRLNG
jgi:hypothetical protein